MRKVLTLVILIFLSVTSYSQKKMKAELKEASVYLKGAELLHKTTTQLQRGQNEILIEGLSSVIDINSLKIKATKGVIVSSFEFVRNTSTSSISPESKLISDSIKEIGEKLLVQSTKLQINTDLKNLLDKGMSKSLYESEKGVSVEEITKSMNYFESKSHEVIKNTIDAQVEINKLNIKKNELNANLQKAYVKKEDLTGSLKLTLTSALVTPSELTISYYTPLAGWTPYYDINVISTEKPVRINSRGKVRQTTGMDWTDVKLSLSSSTPSFGTTAPLFSTWFLREAAEIVRIGYGTTQMSASYAMNTASYDKRLSKDIASEKKAPKTSAGVYYVVNGNIISESEFNKIDRTAIKELINIDDKSQYGLSDQDKVIQVVFKSEYDNVNEEENALSVVYNIDVAYSIPGDGKEQSVELKEQQIDAEYSYYCASKLDKQTYLIAEIPGWQKLNLASGQASITYNEVYIGKTQIDANSTNKKLTLTLGADKRVAVKRELLKDFSSTKFFGSNVLKVFTYKITVKNNQNKTIRVVTKDQYPTSTSKAYTVELLPATTTPTFNNEEVGVITWEEDFQAGETKVYQISYSVKYPKDVNLNF